MIAIYNADELLDNIKFVPLEENTLEQLQDIVGGYIEMPYLATEIEKHGMQIVCNEEGKYNGSEPTLAVTDKGKIYDIIYGNIAFVNIDEEEGVTTDLTEEQIAFLKEKFNSDNAKYILPYFIKTIEVKA